MKNINGDDKSASVSHTRQYPRLIHICTFCPRKSYCVIILCGKCKFQERDRERCLSKSSLDLVKVFTEKNHRKNWWIIWFAKKSHCEFFLQKMVSQLVVLAIWETFSFLCGKKFLAFTGKGTGKLEEKNKAKLQLKYW